MSEVKHTPGPWRLCTHLQSKEKDESCRCGYRGVIWGPDNDMPMAVCQPGHDPESLGQEGLGPVRYSRDVELANARLIAAAPDMLDALKDILTANVDGKNVHRYLDAIDAANAAIAKAEGRA